MSDFAVLAIVVGVEATRRYRIDLFISFLP